MLKLREPVKLNLRNDLLSSRDYFTERIRGNYSYMGSELNDADLLHLTTQPPEVYLMGGGMTNMVNNANVENTQVLKVNVINNLINRILISADAKLSYQDTVYISNVLHKLGIKDDRRFMSEVHRLTKQTKQLNDVTKLYWENIEELREMINEYAGDMRLEFKSENEVINNSVLHLHEVVNRRLKTAAIYQIMRNYYENTEGDRSITNAEFKISEQGRFAKEVLLNRLRETVRFETQPLVYKHDNIYEGDETNVDNMSIEQLNERINSAVLLNLIDNIYELSYERTDHNVHNWVSTEDSYYGSSDNVLYRLEQNTAYLQYLHEEYVKNLDEVENYTAEIENVKQLLDIRQDIERNISISESRSSFDNRISENYYNESAEMLFKQEGSHADGDTVIINNEGSREERLYNDQRIREGDSSVSSTTQINAQQINIDARMQQQIQGTEKPGEISPAELTHVSNDIRNEGDTYIDGRSDIRRQGDVNLYDQSTVRENITANINNQTVNNTTGQPGRPQDQQPAELTHITNEGDTNIEERSSQSSLTINESLYQTYQQNIARNRRYMQNLKNILEANAPESTELTPAQRTMQAAAMALEHPERVIEQYTQSETRERERLETIRRESEKLLHPLQQRAHQLIREYLKAPERFYKSELISRDDLGVLLHDIYSVTAEDQKAGEKTGSGVTIMPGSREGAQAGAPLYPAASDTRAAGSGYPETGRMEIEPERQKIYEALELQNIYPVYNISEEYTPGTVTRESIAGSIRERTQALKEAASENKASTEVLEHILREENISEREFASVSVQREVREGREVMTRHQNETVSRLLESVVNRWARRQIESAEPVYSYEDEKLSFVHKSIENTVDEETIENIRQEMQRMEQTQRSINEHTQNLIREEKTVVNNVHSQTIEQNSEEILKVVNTSVRDQLDVITEKVYGRIERQLKNEQRRRGL